MKQLSTLLALQFLAVFAFAQTHNVTFSVDMSNAGIAFTQVYVSGEFNGWSGDGNPLTDQGGGIWSATLPLSEGYYDFKFTADNWANQENFTGGTYCTTTNGGFVNRLLYVDGDMTYGTVCWDSCYACADMAPTGTRNVTFAVDMTPMAGMFTTAYVSGSFNGWAGTANPLTDQGNGIWSATLAIPVGFHEFKFTADDWASQENFTIGDPCTVENFGFVNRFLNVGYNDTILPEYGWNLCTGYCGTPSNLMLSNLQDTAVTIGWDSVPGATNYKVRYRQAGGPWMTMLTGDATPEITIDGLTPATGGRYIVRAWCPTAGTWGDATSLERFVTLAMSCDNPDSLSTMPVGPNMARLNWGLVANARNYVIRWREMGTSMWNMKTKDGDKDRHWLTGLSDSTSYEWQIKTVCAPNNGGNPWSASQMFMTAPSAKTVDLVGFGTGDDNPFVSVFPNPADERLNIALSLDADFDGQVMLVDAAGRAVVNRNLTRAAGSYTEQLDLSSLAPGMYILSVQDANLRYIERVVVR